MKSSRPVLDSEEQDLKNKLDELYKRVSDAINKALTSLVNYDTDIAAQVVNEDSLINALQHNIEELSVLLIARQQPVASDLRKVMTDIYISMELERIADHAVAIARIVPKFEVKPDEQYVNPILDIAEKCKSMLTQVKQAFDNADEVTARNVAAMDDEIDSAEKEVNDFMLQEICGNPEHKKACTYLLWITHNLERIGDRITNIAERVVYMATNEMPDLNP
jgi:phosphate transport system protein